MFTTLFHADWSTSSGKRWAASAVRDGDMWTVTEPRPVLPSLKLLEWLFDETRRGPVLAGFDFPIGLPTAYGSLTGADDFGSALAQFGQGRWSRFYDVAEKGDEVSLERPFYP